MKIKFAISVSVLSFILIITMFMISGCECKHQYTSSITKEPTCAEEGETTYTCSVCGDTYTESIAKSNEHQYTSKVTKEATYAEIGKKHYSCLICGYTYTEVMPKTNVHRYRIKTLTNPSINGIGYKREICIICQKQNTVSYNWFKLDDSDNIWGIFYANCKMRSGATIQTIQCKLIICFSNDSTESYLAIAIFLGNTPLNEFDDNILYYVEAKSNGTTVFSNYAYTLSGFIVDTTNLKYCIANYDTLEITMTNSNELEMSFETNNRYINDFLD